MCPVVFFLCNSSLKVNLHGMQVQTCIERRMEISNCSKTSVLNHFSFSFFKTTFYLFYYQHYCRCPHSSLSLPLPTSTQLPRSLWPSPYYCLCPRVMHICSLPNLFPFIESFSPSLLTAITLFHVSMPLFC